MVKNDSISEDSLIELARAGSIRALRAVQSSNGRFALLACIGMDERPLRSQREDVRTWASLDTLVRYTRDRLGINRFEVVSK